MRGKGNVVCLGDGGELFELHNAARVRDVGLNIVGGATAEKLVVIVSHNLDEADMFADRIIELHDGKLLSDKVRVNDEQKRFEITDDTVYLPYFRDLTSDEAEALDKKLKTGSITNIVQLDDGFEDFTDAITSDKRVELKKKKFSNKARRKYTKTYVTKNLVSKLVTIVIATLMLLCVTVFASLSPIGHEDVKYTADDAFLPVIKGGTRCSRRRTFCHLVLHYDVRGLPCRAGIY